MEQNKITENNQEYVCYEDVLTDKEIVLCAQLIDDFTEKKINYKELEQKFLSMGITIQPLLRQRPRILWFSGIPSKEIEDNFKIADERIAKKEYLACDIDNYVLNSEKFKNVLFNIDDKAVELLANAGNLKYKCYLIDELKERLKRSDDSTPEMVVNRRNWLRQIEALELDVANAKDETVETKKIR